MGAVVAYDVSGRQTEVKNEMLQRGYLDFWTNTDNGTTCYLPHSTLWKAGISLEAALADIKAAAAAQRVSLERAIVVQSSPWAGICHAGL
jgi:hypothetical protein